MATTKDSAAASDISLKSFITAPAPIAKALEKLVGARLIDLVFHKPVGLLNRKFCTSLDQAQSGDLISVILTPTDYTPGRRRGQPSRVHCQDEVGNLCDLVFFKAMGDYLSRVLPLGKKRLISGSLKEFRGLYQISHPEHIGKPEDKEGWSGIEPVYPLTQKVSSRFLQSCLQRALKFFPNFPEWGADKTIKTYHWPTFPKALRTIHSPKTEEDLSGTNVARQRLAYDEFLAQQMSLLLNRKQRDKNDALAFKPAPDLLEKFLGTLPFQLTGDQHQVLEEIQSDLSSPIQMRRLVQGDVGSGKTVVAFCSALPILAEKGQVAFLAPTEILARQHFETIGTWAKSMGLNTALLIGGLPAAKKKTLKKEIQSGIVSVVVGTHALLQDNVSFQNLGLVVIDEQHRFGVTQRLQLAEKGKSSNMLAMSATPIPRTLMLAAYGDLDISTLREKPAGRQPIDTRLISTERLGDVVNGLQRALSQGQKAYWVCPLVEESEVLDLAAAEDRYEYLKKIFGDDVGVIHGRMKTAEKEAAMTAFTSGETKILVATTVVEVGVDVKDATIIVIEHAERFGLAQLHQLRGRVGRGDQPSTCLLLFSHALTPVGRERLKVLRESNDGFHIAEADLKIRGGGDILGLRQSGFPDFRLGELPGHLPLLHQARKDAEDLLKADPTLSSAQGLAVQSLLPIFGHTDAAQNLKAG